MIDSEDYYMPVPSNQQMKVTDIFSFSGGINKLKSDYMEEFTELVHAVEQNSSDEVFVKRTDEENKDDDKLLASPAVMNHNILMEQLKDKHGWSINHALNSGEEEIKRAGKNKPYNSSDNECKFDICPDEDWGEKTIDGIKNRLGVEVQFGKYSFLAYDILGKFGHFKLADKIDMGVEVVANNNLKSHMSNGPGHYEQIQAEIKGLSEDYISSEYRVPIIVIGIGFKRNKINLAKLDKEIEYIKQTNIADWSSF